MNFDIRKVGNYKNLEVEVDDNKFDLGLHDEKQSKQISAELIHASEGMLGEIPEEIGEAYWKIFEYLEND